MDKVTTGCKELDDWLKGGLPKGSILLITGPTGTLKSSFAYSILYHQAKRGRKGVHILLEQPKENFEEHLSEMGLATHLQEAQLVSWSSHLDIPDVVEATETSKSKVLERTKKILDKVRDSTKGGKYRGIVFDSLTAFTDLSLQCPNVGSERVWIRDLYSKLRLKDGIAIVISEWRPNTIEGPEMYLADGILRTYRLRTQEGGTDIVMICDKMRAINVPRMFKRLNFKGGRFELDKTKIRGANFGALEG